ncbi:carbamoyltransferase [Elusimicrobiota bacterium]
MMYILGVSCWYHDAAAALLKDGRIVACSEEERFSRVKHDCDFPINAINFCLKKAAISADSIDYVVFYDKPLIKFERILTSIIRYSPRSMKVFREAVPLWLREKLHFRKVVRKKLRIKDDRILFCSHHMSHAASAFFLSPFDEAAVLTVDGVGEWATASIGTGKGNTINITSELRFPHSLGLLYSAFTAFLGFKVNNGEYKVMGMAPYGVPKYKDKVLEVVKVSEDGSIELDLDYFCFAYSTENTYTSRFTDLFGEPRDPDSLFFTQNTEFPAYYGEKPDDFDMKAKKNQYYADIAASIQDVLEEILVNMAKNLHDKTQIRQLCYSGGVALNSKANYRLVSDCGFSDVFIQPAATDAGGALGAALWCWCEVLGNNRQEVMSSNYMGKGSSNEEISAAIESANLQYDKLSDEGLFDEISDSLIRGEVVGWYQGSTEWGPRALGNRSILADPRSADMKNRVNTVIKFREPYRPFAPSILSEDVDVYIERPADMYLDRFMLVTYPVRRDKRSIIPAVTHVNGTARIQSVHKEANPRYWELISRFKSKTGVGVVLNTSFNLKGEPIVNTPADAISTFKRSGLDILVLENYIIKKKERD